MTEPKPYWMRIDMDGIHLHEENIYNDGTCKLCSDKELNMAKFTGTIDGQPLSTKQLQELIVSQSMTIDAALTRQGELVDALKRIRDLVQKGQYIQVTAIIAKVLGV